MLLSLSIKYCNAVYFGVNDRCPRHERYSGNISPLARLLLYLINIGHITRLLHYSISRFTYHFRKVLFARPELCPREMIEQADNKDLILVNRIEYCLLKNEANYQKQKEQVPFLWKLLIACKKTTLIPFYFIKKALRFVNKMQAQSGYDIFMTNTLPSFAYSAYLKSFPLVSCTTKKAGVTQTAQEELPENIKKQILDFAGIYDETSHRMRSIE